MRCVINVLDLYKIRTLQIFIVNMVNGNSILFNEFSYSISFKEKYTRYGEIHARFQSLSRIRSVRNRRRTKHSRKDRWRQRDVARVSSSCLDYGSACGRVVLMILCKLVVEREEFVGLGD